MVNLTFEQIYALNDDEILNAMVTPSSPKLALRIFNFIRENDNLLTTISGMSVTITGLNRFEIISLSKTYNLNMGKYMFFIKWYEDELLKVYSELTQKK